MVRRADCHHLFVYGSLMRDLQDTQQEIWMQSASYLCKGHFPGELYEVAGYPGATHSPTARLQVHGELFEILDPELLDSLDRYEECHASSPRPHPYRRRIVPIQGHDDFTIPAWVYLYQADTSGLQKIDEGDYLHWLQARGPGTQIDRP